MGNCRRPSSHYRHAALDSARFSSMSRWPLSAGDSVPAADGFLGRGSVFLANRMLIADRHTVCTKHAALLRWGQEDESAPLALDLRVLGLPSELRGHSLGFCNVKYCRGFFLWDPAEALVTDISPNNNWGGNC